MSSPEYKFIQLNDDYIHVDSIKQIHKSNGYYEVWLVRDPDDTYYSEMTYHKGTPAYDVLERFLNTTYVFR